MFERPNGAQTAGMFALTMREYIGTPWDARIGSLDRFFSITGNLVGVVNTT